MSDTTHSILAPSSAARAVQCPGSVLAECGEHALPESDTVESLEGTAAHWAGAQMIEGVMPQVGEVAPNGVTLTVAMLDEAELWARDVWAVSKQYAVDPQYVEVEKPVRIKGVHPEHGYGTLDTRLWAIDNAGFHLFVWDFKRGHRFVDEYENWQLLDYVRGSLEEKPDIDWARVTVHMRIVQPRAYGRKPVREWTVNARFLTAYFNIRTSRAEEALAPNPTFKPGPECLDCRVRHACPAALATAAGYSDFATREQPHALPPDVIAHELKHIKHAITILKSVESGLEQQADTMMRSGAKVPGMAMKAGDGRTNWTVPPAQAIGLAKMMGIDIAKPTEAITPLQAIARGVPAALVNGVSKPSPGKMSVVLDDGTLARRIGFGSQ